MHDIVSGVHGIVLESARLRVAPPPEREPEHDQEPGKFRGLFRRRP
ncbi:hypothetical protein [Streptomyces atroolivaceus]